MPDNIIKAPFATAETRELARKFRAAADLLDRGTACGVSDVKFFLLAALNDVDRALDYGRPGKGIDDMLNGKEPWQ